MRPVLFAVGWASLMLAVVLAASGIAHDAAYIFARRKMTRARVLRISLALGCYIGLSAPEVLAVAFLFTALFTIYAVTVRTLCREYRKRGLAD